jgi:hypothetical protein
LGSLSAKTGAINKREVAVIASFFAKVMLSLREKIVQISYINIKVNEWLRVNYSSLNNSIRVDKTI